MTAQSRWCNCESKSCPGHGDICTRQLEHPDDSASILLAGRICDRCARFWLVEYPAWMSFVPGRLQ